MLDRDNFVRLVIMFKVQPKVRCRTTTIDTSIKEIYSRNILELAINWTDITTASMHM